jgi:hypothetical protein
MKLDMKLRTSRARVDDADRKRRVTTARHIIYQKNYAVNSEAVENLLKKESWVPTSVSQAGTTLLLSQLTHFSSECVRVSAGSSRVQSFSNVNRRSHA